MSEETGLTIASRGFELKRLQDARDFAETLLKSGFCPRGYDKPEAIIIGLQYGQELGLAPMQALNSIAVINGRPSLWGDALPALVRASGTLEWVRESIEGEGDELKAVCEVKRRGEAVPCVRRFTVAMARRAGLWDKAGPWKSYPARMLAMRARSWAFRDTFADVLRGLQVREELEDVPEVYPAAVAATETIETPRRPRLSEIPDTPVAEEPASVTDDGPSIRFVRLQREIEVADEKDTALINELRTEVIAALTDGEITEDEHAELVPMLAGKVPF